FSLGSGHFLFPYHGPASRTNTRIANSPRSLATTGPPPPAPITITSGSVFILYTHFCLFLIKNHDNHDNPIIRRSNQLAANSNGKIRGVDRSVEITVENRKLATQNNSQTLKNDLAHLPRI